MPFGYPHIAINSHVRIVPRRETLATRLEQASPHKLKPAGGSVRVSMHVYTLDTGPLILS